MSQMLVYFMMQADSIVNAFTLLAFIFGFISGIGFIVFIIVNANAKSDEDAAEFRDSIKTPLKCTSLIFFVSFMGCALMPSTKTIALMVVLPKITSPQALDAMGSEAKDIYTLAKDALKSLSEKKEEKGK